MFLNAIRNSCKILTPAPAVPFGTLLGFVPSSQALYSDSVWLRGIPSKQLTPHSLHTSEEEI